MNEKPFFKYNSGAFGGTEYMAKGFHKDIAPFVPKLKNYACIIIPGIAISKEEMQNLNVPLIFWIHNNIAQFHPAVKDLFYDKIISDKTAYIICVSEYHKQVLLSELPESYSNKIVVITNAIDPIIPEPNKFNNVDKIKIIHASSPDRGMIQLLSSLAYIEEDFELNIYNNFYPEIDQQLHPSLLNDARVNFYGKTPRKIVHKAFASSHIHAYLSTYPETSCLTQMEALSAGCLSVHTNLGALSETSMGYGDMVPAGIKPSEYAKHLSAAIKKVKSGFDSGDQISTINTAFSWETAKQNWIKFSERL
jgi:glycosyltransferase involved in cell wall biosynthesis